MAISIVDFEVKDIRFPTSDSLDGSDAMNRDPDYSAAYVILKTSDESVEGHGLTFTIGRGNDIVVKAIDSMSHLFIGKKMEDIIADMGGFWKEFNGDSQLRWLGPEKGVIHLATGAIINAIWDIYAKMEGRPVWQLIADMSPEELVRCVDFTYITDAITPEEAIEMLTKLEPTKQERIADLKENGYPAYTTSAGWLGYTDEKIRTLCREAIANGWSHIKMKVGADLEDDMKRAALIREEIGDDARLMMDANQRWDVGESIENMKKLAKFNPYWIEEPTSPDDILGHATIARAVAPIKVATGEHCQNRVMFKQLLQANSIEVCQIDSCRVGGVNEVLAILLMAAKFNVPVCPHAGGVGLCEYVQHLSMIDYICISGSLDGRMIEYADHLHDHFIDRIKIKNGKYVPPTLPGYSVQMKQESLDAYTFPEGEIWVNREKALQE
ncbi:MAG: L-fuconate dehydratase [Flavobacteriales bacterium]|nr:L-fuconate dehydratase [Flavobacteriales bacterium]